MNAAAKPRLWLALRFLDIPLQALTIAQPTLATCIVDKQRVICASAAAKYAGVSLGMDATNAHLLSNCQIFPREPAREQALLNALADHLYRFTPYIEFRFSKTQADAGLLLEISRCLNLFGGVNALSEKIFSTIAEFSFAYGLAHSAAAAWLLSHHHYPITGDENKALFLYRLKHISIDLFDEHPEAIEALKRTGFSTLEDIAQQITSQSISPLKKRLGDSFAHYISDVFGIDHDFQQQRLFENPATVFQPKELYFDTVQLDYPVAELDYLQNTLQSMLQKLNEHLHKRQLSCQHIEWRFLDIYQNSDLLLIQCDKTQNQWQLLYQLTLIRLESRQLPFAVDAIELICRDTQKRSSENLTLKFSGKQNCNDGSHNLTLIEAKLKARLGEQSIFKISYRDNHIPEHSSHLAAINTTSVQYLPDILQHNPRPSWLFDTPLAITAQQHNLRWRGDIKLLAGPERIEGNWWETATARDYYVAQREDGLRLWVFRDLLCDNWFVQGVFA